LLKHQHVIIRAEVNQPPGANDIDSTQLWFKNLIEAIGMKILLGPFVVYCDMPGNRGMTGISAIETSSITLHAWDEDSPGVVQLDVYTCADLDLSIVLDHLKVFAPTEVEYHFIDRDADKWEDCCGSVTCGCANTPSKIKVIDQGKVSYMQAQAAE